MDRKSVTEKLSKIYNEAKGSLSKDVDGIRDDIISPAIKLGKNRFISAASGAKTGFILGAKLGPYGLVKGAAAGAVLGAIFGPAALEKIERWIGYESNDNKKQPEEPDITSKPDDRPKPK